MPVISVERDELFERIQENFGNVQKNILNEEVDKKFDELCFSYGLELDDVTSERMIKYKETGIMDNKISDDIIYKIEIPANRYDLLCIEGLSRALRIFLGKEKPPIYKTISKNKSIEKMIIKKEVIEIRPYVVCAILRNITFNKKNYQSFIDLQEKLHQNICRKRTLVSIGTHDLDTIKGPFTYEALPPKEIKFAPLNNSKIMDGEQLMQHLENDLHLKKYLSIIRNFPKYPVIYDSNRTVLSLPPIINSDHSKITLNTRNVFIEVTATDFTKANVVLNTICAMFSEYCKEKFCIEPVEIIGIDQKNIVTPNLSNYTLSTSVNEIISSIGVDLEADNIVKLLNQMSLEGKLSSDKKLITVSVPCTRSDILHPCDIIEDVAIAYGFNNIPATIPNTSTIGKQFPLNKLTDMLRIEIAMAGYTEVLNFVLCSRDENFKFLNKIDDNSAVSISNSVTSEFEISRTTLLAGMLQTIKHNKQTSLPIRIFEIADVVFKDKTTEVGARNQRNLCIVYCSHTSGFEIIHGLLDRIMLLLKIAWKEEGKTIKKNQNYYYLKPSEDLTFFPGRRADIYVNDKKIGIMGIIHPEVLSNFRIPLPCSALEICIESFI